MIFSSLRQSFLQYTQGARREPVSSESPLFTTNECETFFITRIRAQNILSGLRYVPSHFYVAVDVGGKITKSSHKAMSACSTVEWEEEIRLPSERSSIIFAQVYASVEPATRPEVSLLQFRTTVGAILDRSEELQSIGFVDENNLLSCSSLEITTERRTCDVLDGSAIKPQPHRTISFEYAGYETINRCPLWLRTLGHFVAIDQFWDLADLNTIILMFEEAGHLDRVPFMKINRLCILGRLLLVRYDRHKDLTDLDRSISVFQESLHLGSHFYFIKPLLLTQFSTALLRRYELLTNITDINQSVSMAEEALHLLSWVPSIPMKKIALYVLGNVLYYRAMRTNDLVDMNRAISIFQDQVRFTPNGSPIKLFILINLGLALSFRFNLLGDSADLNESVSVSEQAVNLTPDSHPTKPALLNLLGRILIHRHCIGGLADIEKSISLLGDAICLPSTDFIKPHLLQGLGLALEMSYQYSHSPSDLSAAILYSTLASRSSAGSAYVRFTAACHWISCAHLYENSATLLDAYATAINLLPRLAWVGLPLSERHRELLKCADIARDAAATALEAGYADMAVEWLENGRSIVWSQLLQLRVPTDDLRVGHPDLANQFQSISQELEQAISRTSTFTSMNDIAPSTWSSEGKIRRHHDLALKREKLLTDIRSLSGFDRFLLPKTFVQLSESVHSGPVVFLSASKRRCDALIITAASVGAIPVALPDISYEDVEQMFSLLHKRHYPTMSRDDISTLIGTSQDFLNSLIEDGIKRGEREGKAVDEVKFTSEDRLRGILAFLWKTVVRPVLEALGLRIPPTGTKKNRLFWCPTGPFAFLPIHAAGFYDATRTGEKLSDFVISSYIPTLSVLSPSARNESNVPSSNIRLLAVPQPPNDGQTILPCVQQEIDQIETLPGRSPFVTLQKSHGTVEDVMEKMKTSDWVHFACHGIQDPENPLDSGICLADRRRLKVSDIIQLSRPRGGLAFLSACQTARGDEKLSEESVHLAAAMLFAGYSGVIATMWSIMDHDAPKVTQMVYDHLFRDGKVPDSTEAAEALHHAVQHLRESGAAFESWVPFIHVGQ